MSVVLNNFTNSLLVTKSSEFVFGCLYMYFFVCNFVTVTVITKQKAQLSQRGRATVSSMNLEMSPRGYSRSLKMVPFGSFGTVFLSTCHSKLWPYF